MGEFVPAFSSFEKSARKRLVIVETARSLEMLAVIPGNRFEALRGERAGQYSVRINDQWRICFEWDGAEAYAVSIEIVDYH
jgi:proteic killer suppression protein